MAAPGTELSTADEFNSCISRFARDINCLSDADKFKRKRAIQALGQALLDATDAPSYPTVVRVATHIGPTLAGLLADPAEMNREAATALFTSFFSRDEAEGSREMARGLFGVLELALHARVGKTPFPEESEELRLKLAQLLNKLIECPADHLWIQAHPERVVDMLASLAADSFHSVKVESSKGVVLLAGAMPSKLHVYLSPLVNSQIANLTHQRGPVRMAALDAMTTCLPHGAESLPRVLADSVLPALRLVRFDRTSGVRRQLAVSCAHLLSELPPFVTEPSDGFAPHLLYIASGLMADEAPEVGLHALQVLVAAVEAIGATRAAAAAASSSSSVFLTEDLRVAAEAATVDPVAAMSLAGGGISVEPVVERSDASNSNCSMARSEEGVGAALPPPFDTTPVPASLVSFVNAYLPTLMKLVLEDLREWTAKTRLFAAGALRSVFVLGQGGMTAHLSPIVAALCAGSRDDDSDVRRMLGECGRMLGVFIAPEAQLGVLIPQLRGELPGHNNAQHYAAALAVLAAALSCIDHAVLAPHLHQLADTLALDHLAEDDPIQLRGNLALALQALVEQGLAPHIHLVFPSDEKSGGGETDDAMQLTSEGEELSSTVVEKLVCTVLHLADTSVGDDIAVVACGSARTLAIKLGYRHTASLISDLCGSLLPAISGDVASWNKTSAGRRCFDTLLRIARPALAGRDMEEGNTLIRQCVDVFTRTLNPSSDPELRISMLALLDAFILGDDTASGSEATHTPTVFALHRTMATRSLDACDAARLLPSLHSPHGTLLSPPPPEVYPGSHARASGGSFGRMDVLPTASIHAVASPVLAVVGEGGAHTVSNACVDHLLSAVSHRLVREACAPNMVWRVGQVASTIRKVSVACLLALLRRHLTTAPGLASVWPEVRPVIAGCLSDDDAATRLMTTTSFQHVFTLLACHLDDMELRAIYPELLKRLDDSTDSVRIAACSTLATMATAMPIEVVGGSVAEYTLDALLVHLDDTNPEVQLAVFKALTPIVSLVPAHAVKELSAVRPRHRNPTYCDQLLALALPR